MTAAIALQIWIAVTGLAAIALLQFGGRRARGWAPFIGLAGQPAWLWHSIDAQALGIGMVSAAYTVVWVAGCVKEIAAARCEFEDGRLSALRALREVQAEVQAAMNVKETNR